MTGWYRRDASWHASHGRAQALHLPRGDGLALCSSRIVIMDDEPPEEDFPEEQRCRRCSKVQNASGRKGTT